MIVKFFLKLYYLIFCRAIAASAPVAQFTAPCDAFGRIVTADYTKQDEVCSSTIRLSWSAIKNVTQTGKPQSITFPEFIIFIFKKIFPAEGLAWFNEKWRFCTPLAGVQDVDKFKAFLSDLWTNLVMMDYPYPTSFLSPLPGNPVLV